MPTDENFLKYLSRESRVALVDTSDGLKTIADATSQNNQIYADAPVYYMGQRMTLKEYLEIFRRGGFPWQH